MGKILISEVRPDIRYKSPVTLGNMFILTVPPCPITKGQIANLKKWGFKELFV